MTVQVIALPGGVMPAAERYAHLARMLGADVQLHTKDLEVYAGPEPPAGYSVQMEVEAVERYANALGLERFHLLGYSGGGFVSLAYAGAHPERLLSLALFEPAGIPGRHSPEEVLFWGRLASALAGKTGPDFMRTFMTEQVKPGVELAPPAGPPQPWMAKRPAGLAAMMAAFGEHPFDRSVLSRCDCPTFYGYGALTGLQEEPKVGILARLLPDIHVRRFGGIHHFVPPEQIYSADHVEDLRELWTRAGMAVMAGGRG